MGFKRECKYCGTIVDIDTLERDTDYLCPVCKSLVYRMGQPFRYVLFLSLTSLILFLWLLNLPLLSVKILGIERTTSFIVGLGHLISTGELITALILWLSVIIIPYTMLVIRIAVIVAVKLKAISPLIYKLISFYKVIAEWNMAEVYLVGIFVAIIKLRSIADITVGLGTLVFILFLTTFYVSDQWFNPDDIKIFCDNYRCSRVDELMYFKESFDEA